MQQGSPHRFVELPSLLWLALTVILAYSYAEIWLDGNAIWDGKPYVYRVFVPLVASATAWLTGLGINQAVVLVVMLCALGFAWSAHYLYRSFHE